MGRLCGHDANPRPQIKGYLAIDLSADLYVKIWGSQFFV